MTARAFFDLVVAMRYRQREYYATKSHDALVAAKALEQRVDDEVARVTALLRKREAEGGDRPATPPPEPMSEEDRKWAAVEQVIKSHKAMRGVVTRGLPEREGVGG